MRLPIPPPPRITGCPLTSVDKYAPSYYGTVGIRDTSPLSGIASGIAGGKTGFEAYPHRLTSGNR